MRLPLQRRTRMEVCRVAAAPAAISHLRGNCINGTTLYATNADPTGGVTTCSINGDGSLSGCNEDRVRTSGIAAVRAMFTLGRGQHRRCVCDWRIGQPGRLHPHRQRFSAWTAYPYRGSYAYIATKAMGPRACARSIPMAVFPLRSLPFQVSRRRMSSSTATRLTCMMPSPRRQYLLVQHRPRGVLTGCGIPTAVPVSATRVQIAVH